MASRAFPALVLLVLICGQLVVGGHAQPYIGGTRGGGGSAAGLRPPTSTATHGHSSTIAMGEDKSFMINSLPAHDHPLPVPPSGDRRGLVGQGTHQSDTLLNQNTCGYEAAVAACHQFIFIVELLHLPCPV
ncbi:unnamed protein product [Triticum turgidum subsp. durum]|uniref:Uncharacterized protein n=1 Tax=Triticum turgidum subsp. durum TaxID=4567 RepID=A0A9R0Y981_TRITD|nr:unnamed protein product [Triticum turgidum subsp. durum]